MAPHPAVAAIRLAVRAGARRPCRPAPGAGRLLGRRRLAGPGRARWPSRRRGTGCAGGVTVDHGLQAGSAEQASRVTAGLAGWASTRCDAVRVTVAGRAGGPATRPRGRGAGGPVRGPGPSRRARRPRSCSGTPSMTRPRPSCSGWPAAPAPGRWPGWPAAAAGTGGRCSTSAGPDPGGLRRAGLTPWDDPHNADPAYARFRVRHRAAARARRAARAGRGRGAGPDGPAAARRTPTCSTSWPPRRPPSWPTASRRPGRRRAGRAAARHPDPAAQARGPGRGRPRGRPRRTGTSTQMDALVTGWHGQRGVDLPGGIRCQRRDGRLLRGPTGDRDAGAIGGSVDATDMGADLQEVLITPGAAAGARSPSWRPRSTRITLAANSSWWACSRAP